MAWSSKQEAYFENYTQALWSKCLKLPQINDHGVILMENKMFRVINLTAIIIYEWWLWYNGITLKVLKFFVGRPVPNMYCLCVNICVLCRENVSLLPDEIKLYTTCISDLFVITNFFLPILCLYSTDKAPNSHKPMIAEGRRMQDFFPTLIVFQRVRNILFFSFLTKYQLKD